MNSQKKLTCDQKHLTLSDRTYIQQELLQKSTFSFIANTLKKDPTTIAKEVKRNFKSIPVKTNRSCITCIHYADCDLLSRETSCSHYDKKYCSFYCKKCYHYNPTRECSYYVPFKCNIISKPPYVCNYCSDQKSCPLTKKIYDASYAQRQYEKTLVKSRQGINMTPEELQELNEMISRLMDAGKAFFCRITKTRLINNWLKINAKIYMVE